MSADTFIPAEFDCVECGRHIVVLSSPEPSAPRLCNVCLFQPGWFRIPELRALIDPGHSGHEVEHTGRSA